MALVAVFPASLIKGIRAMQILMIEDEPKVADFVRRGLKAEGWFVDHAPDAENGLDMLGATPYDLVLLDVMLPGMSGIDLCRRLRASKNQIPILMLSALADTENRVGGLRQGADDYLPKPFEFDELIARLEALHRRTSQAETTMDDNDLSVGPIRYDQSSMKVYVDDGEIEISSKERDVLVLMMKNAGRVCSRERLLNSVWGFDVDPLTNVVDVTVSRLRRKLAQHSERIATVRGYGYRLDL
jgi:DNA-binding response OmpR family regulator